MTANIYTMSPILHLGPGPCAAIFVLIFACDRKENKNDLKKKKKKKKKKRV